MGKRSRAKAGVEATAAPAPRPNVPVEWIVVGVAALVAFWAYWPAMHGPFLFDDQVLPFARLQFGQPLRDWMAGVRPVLMLTYWMNAQVSGTDPFSYHLVNVLMHCVTSGLVFLIVRRFLEWAAVPRERLNFWAGFASVLFLLHPVATEAVAYLAGRSEALSVMLIFAAWTLFLYRPDPAIGWKYTFLVLGLFGAALLSKEHTIVLPALLLLTDFWWNPGFSTRGIKSNWRLYGLMALGAIGGVAFFWKLITSAQSAGFSLKDFTWYQYFFTQCRALFVYVREFLFPAWLTADWDFPASKTILDQGAILGLLALIGLAVAAWVYRKKYPLPAFGYFAYLLLMSPTSSILPIQDTIAERRLYLGMPGLLLILVGFLSRIHLRNRSTMPALCAVALLLAALVTHARAAVWSDPVALWQDTVAESPGKFRDHFQLANAYMDAGRCSDSVVEFQKTADLNPHLTPNWRYNLLVDWGLAYDCIQQSSIALDKFRQAAAIDPTAHVYSQIASVYGKQSKYAEALDALAEAEKRDPNYAPIYAYRGVIDFKSNRFADAIREYQHALQLDPTLDQAQLGLAASQQALARGHQ